MLSTVYSAFDWSLTIDNHLLTDRFVNELTRSQIPATDRTIDCKITTQYTSAEATGLYNLAANGGGACTAVFTSAEETINATTSTLTFTTPYLVWPGTSPSVPSKQAELHLELNGRAYKTGASAELTITNAHG